ncbi:MULTISPECIES: EscE/YscE/SsaE family type III secretion system needle protein co-chaperone [Arsenophonus]|jgi:type III secretion system YseE family protein|uniref:EscE/YscE/SsaE family type III secretion system needle protein co-chaperone n=1 Tax=Arsenophonus TaxID=637 RepID=UPI0015D74998|nr:MULTISPECIES: EscE/YscE/SsaE family type III secretion system needle protein co-chaperone [Arsenophonus]UBX28404.1 hypothetical protein LDL57_11355 [Arsenophonus apicola]
MLTELEQIVSDNAEYIKIQHYLYDQLNNCRKKLNKPLLPDEHQQIAQQQTAIWAGITVLEKIKRS